LWLGDGEVGLLDKQKFSSQAPGVESDPANFAGWELLDALERTADPDLWDVKLEAQRELDGLGPRPAVYQRLAGFGADRPPRRYGAVPGSGFRNLALDTYENKEAVLAKSRKRINEAFEKAVLPLLVVQGCRQSPAVAPVVLPFRASKSLRVNDWARSILVELTPEKVRIYDARFFPVLHAPGAATIINGLSEHEIFERYVVEDPEVKAQRLRAEKAAGRLLVPSLRDAQAVAGVDDLVEEWFGAASANVGETAALRRYAELVIDRCHAMRRLPTSPPKDGLQSETSQPGPIVPS
jgi:hypothetical protein